MCQLSRGKSPTTRDQRAQLPPVTLRPERLPPVPVRVRLPSPPVCQAVRTLLTKFLFRPGFHIRNPSDPYPFQTSQGIDPVVWKRTLEQQQPYQVSCCRVLPKGQARRKPRSIATPPRSLRLSVSYSFMLPARVVHTPSPWLRSSPERYAVTPHV